MGECIIRNFLTNFSKRPKIKITSHIHQYASHLSVFLQSYRSLPTKRKQSQRTPPKKTDETAQKWPPQHIVWVRHPLINSSTSGLGHEAKRHRCHGTQFQCQSPGMGLAVKKTDI